MAESHRRLPPRERLMRDLATMLLTLNEPEMKDRSWLKHTDQIAEPQVPAELRSVFMLMAESMFTAGYTAALSDVTEWLTGQVHG